VRNKFFILLTSCIFVSKTLADTTSTTTDSVIKNFTPPDNGPLGIDNYTGVALYAAAILFAVLVIALWRKNIISRRQNIQ
jgi:hypothetical protein